MNSDVKYVTAPRAAALLGVKKPVLYQMIEDGDIPAVKIESGENNEWIYVIERDIVGGDLETHRPRHRNGGQRDPMVRIKLNPSGHQQSLLEKALLYSNLATDYTLAIADIRKQQGLSVTQKALLRTWNEIKYVEHTDYLTCYQAVAKQAVSLAVVLYKRFYPEPPTIRRDTMRYDNGSGSVQWSRSQITLPEIGSVPAAACAAGDEVIAKAYIVKQPTGWTAMLVLETPAP